MVIELKYDKTAEGAINQIKNKNYTEKLKAFSGELLLVGINYDKENKKHERRIEKIIKWLAIILLKQDMKSDLHVLFFKIARRRRTDNKNIITDKGRLTACSWKSDFRGMVYEHKKSIPYSR